MTTPLRVLVVDDEPDVRLLLRVQLQVHGHEVTGEAADGQEALEAAKADPPDAVILDLLMPGVNGFDAIPMLRRELPRVAIVAYTAVAGDFVRDEMARLGIPLLLKSPDFEPLEAALVDAVSQSRSGAS